MLWPLLQDEMWKDEIMAKETQALLKMRDSILVLIQEARQAK